MLLLLGDGDVFIGNTNSRNEGTAIFASMTNSIHRMEFKVIILLAIQFLSIVLLPSYSFLSAFEKVKQLYAAATNINMVTFSKAERKL